MMGGDRGAAHEGVDLGVGPAVGPGRRLAAPEPDEPFPARDVASELHAKRVRVVFQDLTDEVALPQFTLSDEPPEERVWRL